MAFPWLSNKDPLDSWAYNAGVSLVVITQAVAVHVRMIYVRRVNLFRVRPVYASNPYTHAGFSERMPGYLRRSLTQFPVTSMKPYATSAQNRWKRSCGLPSQNDGSFFLTPTVSTVIALRPHPESTICNAIFAREHIAHCTLYTLNSNLKCCPVGTKLVPRDPNIVLTLAIVLDTLCILIPLLLTKSTTSLYSTECKGL